MKNARKFNKTRLSVVLVMLLALVSWQQHSQAQTSDESLTATANFNSEKAIVPETAIEISLNRKLNPSEKIAVTLEQTDISGLFSQTENRLIYNATLLSLPSGKLSLTVFVIESSGNWKEISRFSLSVEKKEIVETVKPSVTLETAKTNEIKPETNDIKAQTPTTTEPKSENSETGKTSETIKPEESKTEVATPGETPTETPAETEKTKRFNFLPSFTFGIKSLPFQSNFPLDARPAERATFTDFTLSGSLKNEVKMGKFTSESNFDFAGSSFKPETLQFGALGREAPDVDLASYLMNVQIGKAKIAFGHTSFGNNKHLVSSFSSRGFSFTMPINKYFDISAGILNGTSVLGLGNFFGVTKIRHQVQGATLGIEFFPKRQNAMRLEITGFNAYLQALNGVSEGRINDAERSRGFGLRFLTSDKSERFKAEFGYSLSRFFNPQDTELDPDGNAVPLPAVIRSAHYLETSYQVLKDLKLTKTKNLNLTLLFKYEFVEPLYKSVGASASADKFTHDYAVDASIGEITFQAGHTRFNDNLGNIPSILKSLTRGNRFAVALPLNAIFTKPDKPSPFLPRLGYSYDQTLQFGAGIPVNGGFEIDISTIPNQLNTNQNFTSAWQFKKVNLDYTYNRTFADNRQQGSEQADQIGYAHGVTVGVNPSEILSFNVGLNFDNSTNLELIQTNKTKTLTLGMNLQPFKNATFSGNFSNTLAGDAANIINNKNANFDAQFAYNFNVEKSKFKKFGMQMFVRFADVFSRSQNFSVDVNDRTRTKTLNAGMTFNFF